MLSLMNAKSELVAVHALGMGSACVDSLFEFPALEKEEAELNSRFPLLLPALG